MKVCKFGGSSVASADQIRKVRAILDSDRERTVAVVSAPGKRNSSDEKITDMLYRCASLVDEGKSCSEVFGKIAERYIEIAESLEIGKEAIEKELCAVEKNIEGGKGAQYAASRGEYLSAFLIAKAFGWNFLDSEGTIIIGEDNRIEDITYTQLRAKMKKGEKYVIPGFYGTSLEGEITTFSRGGSDITGAIVASALDADVYENWTDVSGVYSSDPRKVKSAHVIDEMSYREVREFSEVGASVFHEEAIAPCVSKGIPINIRNTNAPEDRGTLICKDASHRGVIGVSAKGGLGRIYCQKLMFFKEGGMRHRILSLMHIYGIKPCYTLYGCDSIAWYFDAKQADKIDTDEMCSRIKEEFGLNEIECRKGYAVVGLVGNGIEDTMEYVDALSVLKENGIHPVSVSLGGSWTTFVIGIEEKRKDEAVSLISDRIFGQEGQC